MSQPAQPNGTHRILRWLLGGQMALAVLLVVVDLGPTLPQFLQQTSTPEMDRPTQPGDQTRLYQPLCPTNPARDGNRDMPRRLVAETIMIEGQSAVLLRGAIARGDGARIAEELRQGTPALVAFDSPGGSVSDALTIGTTLRAIDADTRLDDDAICLSACPYMFVGGVLRSVSSTARVGVHQHSFGESTILPAFLAVEDIQRGQAGVLRHLDEMGIDLRIMGPALATAADEIYILTADELRDWNVISD